MKNKKRLIIVIVVAVVVLLGVLFIPIPQESYDDGGTREYVALTYKIVDWNKVCADGIYENVSIYYGDDYYKTIDELWDEECLNEGKIVHAVVTELDRYHAVVEPIEGSDELKSSDKLSFSISGLENIYVRQGTYVEITYMGEIMESYPAQINAISWKPSYKRIGKNYPGKWMDKENAKRKDNFKIGPIRIEEMYADCFIARVLEANAHKVKMNGKISPDWCIGDVVECTYENVYFKENVGFRNTLEADLITIEESDWEPEDRGPVAAKPVIYLYPEKTMDVSVNLELDGEFICVYPSYNDGWNVTAYPDGTLTDDKGQTYNYLYWEGNLSAEYDFSKGFCVKGEDTAKFLEEALEKLGLTRREANEFIVYWLPLMEQNPYNIISFQTDVYTDAAKLSVNPAPDTMIRVFMTWESSDEFVKLPEQELKAPERNGFTVVEWGGTELK